MRFLIDEDVPLKLLRTLVALGHDAIRVTPSTPDLEVAQRAKKERRILVTLDKDFMNRAMFPPEEFNIVRIGIVPPYASPITEAFKKLIEDVPPAEWKGLITLKASGRLRLS